MAGGNFAFPGTSSYTRVRGMELRDWFAGQALIGAIMGASGLGEATKAERGEVFIQLADFMYEIADAMVEAREKSE